MFYFRIDRVRFLDNGGVKSGLGIFGHDFARVKFLSFVTRSDEGVPELDEWVRSNDAASKRALLQTLVDNTLSTRALTEIDRVQDNVPVNFGDTGLILYETEEIPEAFTWTFLAVRSSRNVREAARDVDEIFSEPGFGSFSKSLLGLIQAGSALANPAYTAGVEMAKFVAQANARRLMKKGDRELGAVTVSFIRPEHYPTGIRESHDVHDMTGNMFFDYTIFGYKRALPVIRKKGRQ
ncbi:MAG: hypothetical protein H0X04_10975 [Chthoniobacterales bacterium]|nr:hypothetical protein [Chthoniobacterales bacterium]